MDPAISAIIGALITAIGAIIVALIQALIHKPPPKVTPGIWIPPGTKIHAKPRAIPWKTVIWVVAFTLLGGMFGFALGGKGKPPASTPTAASAAQVSLVMSSCAQQVKQDVFDKETVLEYLRDVFFWWTLTGDTRNDAESNKNLLSAFDSILSLNEMDVSQPEETMKSWIDYTIDRAIAAGVCTTKEQCAFLDFDTSGAIHSLGIEESFWRLWEHANKLQTTDIKPKNMAAIRLALIALVGDDCQKELIGKWNERLMEVPSNSVSQPERTPISDDTQAHVVAISAGSEHVCALRSNGTVWCWGQNYYGQLGDGTTAKNSLPVQVSGLDAVTSIDAGGYHTCALRSDGTVWCWGNNPYGQVGVTVTLKQGDTYNAPVPSPVAVPNLSNVQAISAGDLSSCALRSDATVWCWGDNGDGELGDGSAGDARPTPGQVPGLSEIETISVGGGSVCAVGAKHTAWCWGWNAYGQLGNGTTRAQLTPVAVSNLTDISAISQGNNQHTCAVRSDGTVWCWGWNNQGQLGDGTTTDSSTPRQVPGLSDATDVSAGWRQTCTLRSDGTVWCWGNGETTPSQVGQLKDVTSISAGAYQNCALLSDSTIWCWGDDLDSPMQVTGLK